MNKNIFSLFFILIGFNASAQRPYYFYTDHQGKFIVNKKEWIGIEFENNQITPDSILYSVNGELFKKKSFGDIQFILKDTTPCKIVAEIYLKDTIIIIDTTFLVAFLPIVEIETMWAANNKNEKLLTFKINGLPAFSDTTALKIVSTYYEVFDSVGKQKLGGIGNAVINVNKLNVLPGDTITISGFEIQSKDLERTFYIDKNIVIKI